MSYTALYRKFRPKVFEDVKGQDHIVTTLKNQINASRLGHAYLFCGTRGTGKTTIAKILARAVNCENPKDGEPCGECDCCKSILEGRSMNVIEIDAASNNGVDNIREIKEAVSYPPTEGSYKVYIIDEVHMLSAGAFNALLKTLEEPPSYVIFILATTEVNKIPITILSRCQRYDFRRITIDVIANRLKSLMDIEGVKAEERALRYVAKMGDGSMRDALSLLDQCLAFNMGADLTYESALDILGVVDNEVFCRFLKQIIAGEVKASIELLDEIVFEGRELGLFVSDFTWYLRNVMLVKENPDMGEVLDISDDALHDMVEVSKDITLPDIMRYIRVFSELSSQMRFSSQKRILLEMAVIKLCKPQMEDDYGSLIGRIEQLENSLPKLVEGSVSQMAQRGEIGAAGVGAASTSTSSANIEPEVKLPEALPEEIKAIAQNWHRITAELTMSLKTQLKQARTTLSEDGKLMLVFRSFEYDRFMANEESNLSEIKKIIAEHIQKDVDIIIKKSSDDKNTDRLYPSILSREDISEKLGGFEITEEED